MTRHRVLWVTHRGERHQQAALAAAPAELAVTMRRSPSKEEMISLLPGVEFLVSERTGVIDAEVIAAGRDLRLIQRLGSQVYDIDLQAAKAANIPVCYAPVRSCILVAEHMLMQMLALAKHTRALMAIVQEADDFGQPPRRCDEDYFAYNWSGYRGVLGLWGCTVGILGMGEIGTELARLLRPFGCTVLYNKRHRLPESYEAELNVRFATVGEIAAASDVVGMLIPFFPETGQSLGEAFFAAMKPGSLFVSCGGSGVVDEDALAAALRSGRLGGAALDTYTFEPIARDDPMRALAADPRANVVLTPHTAAGTPAAAPAEAGATVAGTPAALPAEAGATVAGGPAAAPAEAGATVAGGPVAAPAEACATVAGGPVAAPAEAGATVAGGPVAAPAEAGATVAGGPAVHATAPRPARAEDYDNLMRLLRGEPLAGRLV